jgi:hypothetical protein
MRTHYDQSCVRQRCNIPIRLSNKNREGSQACCMWKKRPYLVAWAAWLTERAKALNTPAAMLPLNVVTSPVGTSAAIGTAMGITFVCRAAAAAASVVPPASLPYNSHMALA